MRPAARTIPPINDATSNLRPGALVVGDTGFVEVEVVVGTVEADVMLADVDVALVIGAFVVVVASLVIG
jgi:hypothetical protein